MRNMEMAVKVFDKIINALESVKNDRKIFAIVLKSMHWRCESIPRQKSKSSDVILGETMLAHEEFINLCKHDKEAAKMVEQDQKVKSYYEKTHEKLIGLKTSSGYENR